jgi:glucosamine kinase
MADYFIGVDGGATKTLIRLEDAQGCLLAREQTGAANIRLSAQGAYEIIHQAIRKIIADLGLEGHNLHVGMGLAGCEMQTAYTTFVNYPHNFAHLVVSSDAHAACLGAHQAEDGAIIIAGTGVVGLQIEAGRIATVGGFGFPHDDEGGGAWVGLQAVKIALQAQDKRRSPSLLSEWVHARFNHHLPSLIEFANRANSSAFAELAPLVIKAHQEQDAYASAVLAQAAQAIAQVAQALLASQNNQDQVLPCSLLGGIAPFLVPFLNPDLSARLHPALLAADSGAIFLVKQAMHKQ